MTSERKRQANIRNAQKSTGPRTPSGKAISSKNAISHGLLSKDILLPNEDAEALHTLRETVIQEISPAGKLEEILAERIVAGLWRLARMSRVEADLFRDEMFDREVNAAAAQASSYVSTRFLLPDFPPITERHITDEREYERARRKQAAAASRRAEAILGQIFARKAAEGDVFSKLARYETSLERSILRWLHELQRLQAARCGQASGAAIAVEAEIRQ